MNKFIFVCYDHGCGGEGLSVQISKRPYCNMLNYKMQGGRTWTEDVFDKLLLKSSMKKTWAKNIPKVVFNDKFNVIPSHIPPCELKQVFEDSVFVVINFPTSQDSLLHLYDRIYEMVWMTSQDNLQQKIGYCKEEGYVIDSIEKLKQINESKNNAHIHCIMNDLEFTESNVKKLLDKRFQKHISYKHLMSFKDDHQTIALEYNNIDIKKMEDRLDEICMRYR